MYKMREQEKKCQHVSRVLEIEKGTFSALVFSTTGGIGEESLIHHRRLSNFLL